MLRVDTWEDRARTEKLKLVERFTQVDKDTIDYWRRSELARYALKPRAVPRGCRRDP